MADETETPAPRTPRGLPPRRPKRPRSGARLIAAVTAERLPSPPAPAVVIALVGFDQDDTRALAALGSSSNVATELCGEESATIAPSATALLVRGHDDRTALDRLARARGAGDRRPALVVSESADVSRDAHLLGATFVHARVTGPDLVALSDRGVTYRLGHRPERARWGREQLAPWVLGVLAPCGVTDRKSEIVALRALNERRTTIGNWMGIGQSMVDRHIYELCGQTSQQRLWDIAEPFAERLESSFGLELREAGARR
jgi:hypothetical protein